MLDAMIRVAVVDDHYAVRRGLEAMLSAEVGIEPVGAAPDAAQARPLLYRTAPDLVIIDYRLPRQDGLALCRAVKRSPPAPAIVLYSAFADDWLTVPAIAAGADGIVDKTASARELTEAIRSVAAGGTALPPVRPGFLSAAAAALSPDDQPILGMLVHGTPHQEIAAALSIDMHEFNRRLDRMLQLLCTPAGAVDVRAVPQEPDGTFAAAGGA